MALIVEVGVAELAATRFAVSPLSETVAALLQIAGRNRGPLHLRWLRWASAELAREPLDLPITWPLLTADRPSWPSFLVPAPAQAGSTIDDDLAALRRTTARQVRGSLARLLGDELPPPVAEFAARPAAGLRALAAELRLAFDRLVVPHWPRLRAVLDADVAHRARQLAVGGAERLFADLHPDLRWEAGRLVLGRTGPDEFVNRGPGGLVLMPLALGSPDLLIKRNTTTQTTVRYPARGIGALWTVGAEPPAGAVVRLLGRARADLLEALRSPATTTDLAAALGVSPSAVSQHLRVLREAGLVGRERSGRSVLYLTTELGAALLGAVT
ncbi:metalloregulator ArsR/SmtB family transcription factor [Amycolatopsis sp. NPDC051903]|uniref:metalloregulator ArsR/SmtB family transcription factor n=1 Tax=Amycolatopsis sp. NPDC051903 TaxID=3363936 RepID=UPI003795AA12